MNEKMIKKSQTDPVTHTVYKRAKSLFYENANENNLLTCEKFVDIIHDLFKEQLNHE